MVRFSTFVSLVGMFGYGCALPSFAAANKRQIYQHEGTASHYVPNGVGACGVEIPPGDFAIALSPADLSDYGCFNNVTIVNTNAGITQYALVLDECASCTEGNIEVTDALYLALGGSLDLAWVDVTWYG
ncbi:hypothetical protein IEO21_02421 [Rhodonia placenta]|uniref:RlpA-like protein double-psi beta-barrel domain-containing protein n=1 Tax=Rhodonia placenta TaxID=104341 RepID=A0A8H7U4F5_9APHY|nr:hypothetical protein IEO21_02421 [Postia placenta]